MKAPRYHWWGSLTTVHIENGYLVFLLLAMVGVDLLFLAAIYLMPQGEVYAHESVTSVIETTVVWNHPYGVFQTDEDVIAHRKVFADEVTFTQATLKPVQSIFNDPSLPAASATLVQVQPTSSSTTSPSRPTTSPEKAP